MAFALSKTSMDRLKGVHPDLARVVKRAIAQSPIDFKVLEGLRTEQRQEQLYKEGASRLHHSKHQDGHAVDLGAMLNGQVSWHWPLYIRLAAQMKKASAQLGVPIVWGGDWPHFKDGPHFELPDGYAAKS